MYQFHNISGCTIATCGYLWFNSHSSESNNITSNPKLKGHYQDLPQLKDQLVSDLTHYYQQNQLAQVQCHQINFLPPKQKLLPSANIPFCLFNELIALIHLKLNMIAVPPNVCRILAR